jgi:hypothetical protein
MNTSTDIDTIPPGQVVFTEFGSAGDIVTGLQDEFPGLSRSTVWRWAQPRDAGGTDGIIPSRYHRPLLRLAQRLGRKLSADDLVHGRRAG